MTPSLINKVKMKNTQYDFIFNKTKNHQYEFIPIKYFYYPAKLNVINNNFSVMLSF